MKPMGSSIKYGRSPYAITPREKARTNPFSKQYGERPYLCVKIQKSGILSSVTLLALRFSRLLSQSFFDIIPINLFQCKFYFYNSITT